MVYWANFGIVIVACLWTSFWTLGLRYDRDHPVQYVGRHRQEAT
jgi:hypothetical protein